MNKQELIYKIEKLPYNLGPIVDTMKINRAGLIKLIEQLDEPKKVKVPRFVADWYEENKDSFDYNLWGYLVDWEEQEPSDFKNWINNRNNAFQTLVNMHQFGYTVEKEKRYRVKLKNADISYSLLKRNTEGEWWFGIDFDGESHAHTRKEIEKAGFGEVFDSTLFEVEEVEE